jgi:hypothetical protein
MFFGYLDNVKEIAKAGAEKGKELAKQGTDLVEDQTHVHHHYHKVLENLQ